MGQHDKRYRQQGGGQQEGFSPTSRQQGWNESSRQPQGDFGRDRDHAELGSSDDWRRRQDNLGAYRDDESPSPWGQRGGQDPRYEQDNRYSQYGMRDSERRYDQDSDAQRDQFDPDYSQWRREQMKALDDDYHQWRQDRFKKFSDEFSNWRSSRTQQAGGKNETASATAKSNKDGNNT